jgi:hypothetical protein
MKALFKQLHSMMSDGHNGTLSSKRVVTILAFILCAVGFVANLFWDFTIEEFIYSSMMYIAIAGLGIVGAEKFAPKAPTEKKPEEF